MGFFSKVKENFFAGEERDTANASWGGLHRGISVKLVVLGIIGFLFFTVAGLWGKTGLDLPANPEAPVPESAIMVNQPVAEENLSELQQYEKFLSAQLAQILTQVQGAGEVAVYVSLASGPEYDYAQNRSVESRTTEERDTSGGQRVIQETREDNQLVTVASIQGSKNEGLIRKEVHPPVKGVVVVATGAESSQVKAELIRAAQVALGIGSHQVVVLPKER